MGKSSSTKSLDRAPTLPVIFILTLVIHSLFGSFSIKQWALDLIFAVAIFEFGNTF